MTPLPLPSHMPPLAVVGAGKLGQAVARAWSDAGGTLGAQVQAGMAWSPEGIVFEATEPSAALDNLTRCIDAGVPVVTGTTGWHHDLDKVQVAAAEHGTTVFWSTNFSPGVHATNLIAKEAARVFALLEGYDASIHEVHHTHKKDAPSGTALTLKSHVKKGGWPHEVAVTSERTGDVVGLHTLAWNSVHDAVILQHETKSRQAFAEGAVLALRWTWAKHLADDHGVYTMTDLF